VVQMMISNLLYHIGGFSFLFSPCFSTLRKGYVTLLTALQKIMELAEQLNLEEYQAFIVELMATLAAQHRIDSGIR
jgi:hypothetical protein